MLTFAVVTAGMLLIVLPQVLWGLALILGLRWASAARPTIRQIVLAWFATFGAQFVVGALVAVAAIAIASTNPSADLVIDVIALLASSAATLFVIQRLFALSFLRGVQAWLPTFVVTMAMLGFTTFIVRPYLTEAFEIPTNSMAPTIMGPRLVGQCAQCGAANFTSPPMDSYAMEGEAEQRPMICQHFHIGPSAVPPTKDGRGDHLLTLKFIAPRRWDLVVFRYPDDPSQNYVKRLVGLPGETIVIRDGKAWANGQELVPPAELAGLTYQTPEFHTGDFWGSPEQPAVLADDEYFMLGDFSVAANDARFWRDGAPGHPPYAVPHSYLVGVATHIYWPIDRWRVFR